MGQIYSLRSTILQTTEAVEDLRQRHEKRQVVVCTGEHLILGLTAFMKDILETGDYVDCGGRPVYGFFGFVWKRKSGENGGYPAQIPKGFPSAESFASLAGKYVLPKWEMRYWENCQGAAYEEQVEFDRFPSFSQEMPGGVQGFKNETAEEGLAANTEKTALKVYPGCLKDVMLRGTLQAAVRGGVPVSCCTGFPSLNSAGRSVFMNVTCAGREEGRILLKRRKVKKHRGTGTVKNSKNRRSVHADVKCD